MALAACVLLIVSLGAAADVSQSFRFAFQQGQTADPEKSAPQGNLPPAASSAAVAATGSEPSQNPPAHRSTTLTEASRMAIIRALSGEYARAQQALPGGKAGTHITAGQGAVTALGGPHVVDAADSGPRVNYVVSEDPKVHRGDRVQITKILFRAHSIEFQLNGGGYRHWHLGDHLQIEMAGPVTGGSSVDQPGQPAAYVEGEGATLYLDFDRALPDVSPAEIKKALAPFLDFGITTRSPALQFAQSLPPEFQQAIKDRMAVVGMDRDMVLAAMGRPDRKVRERDDAGNETEDWIYGNPPDRTVFVTFQGDKVVRVRQFH